MFSRFRLSIALALLLTLAFVVPVFAGGWAVITLDSLPTGVVAGEPITVGFTVLQHGITPMTGLDPTVTATLLREDQFVVHAEAQGKPGHYAATLTFPKEGEWQWSVQAFSMDQVMPTLTVAAPVVASKSEAATKAESVQTASISPLWIVRALAFGIGALGLIVAFRRKSRLAVALTALCLAVGVGSLFMGSTVPAAEAESKAQVEEVASVPVVSQVELGGQLFVAKGCITCHVNRKISNSHEYMTIEMGATNLTAFTASPEVLRVRLKDPAAAKSDTKMPNLGLNAEEIEALIAFINSK